jgi:hypothetical protein
MEEKLSVKQKNENLGVLEARSENACPNLMLD